MIEKHEVRAVTQPKPATQFRHIACRILAEEIKPGGADSANAPLLFSKALEPVGCVLSSDKVEMSDTTDHVPNGVVDRS
jgi:hypothetical protein